MFILITNLYKINSDNTFGGIAESHSDVDVDVLQYQPPSGYTFIPPRDESHVWNGEAWVEPPTPYVPTLEDTKETRIAEINEAFETHISGRTPISLGWDMQFKLNDILMVDGAVRALEMTGGTEGYLTDADNVNHYGLSVQQMKQAVLEMTVAHMQAHAHKQQLRDLINSVTSIESLSGVVWLL